MYYIYILFSNKTEKYYVGYTSDVSSRLTRHNSGRNKSTKPGVPWLVVYTEEFQHRAGAWRREKQIKSYKGGRAFKALLESESDGGVA